MTEEVQIHKAPKPTNAVKPLALALRHLCDDWFLSRDDFESGLTLEPYLKRCSTADQLLANLELLYYEITTGEKSSSHPHGNKPSTLIRFSEFDGDEGCSCSKIKGFNTVNDDFVASYEALLSFPKVEQSEAAWLVIYFWETRKSKVGVPRQNSAA